MKISESKTMEMTLEDKRVEEGIAKLIKEASIIDKIEYQVNELISKGNLKDTTKFLHLPICSTTVITLLESIEN